MQMFQLEHYTTGKENKQWIEQIRHINKYHSLGQFGVKYLLLYINSFFNQEEEDKDNSKILVKLVTIVLSSDYRKY